MELIHGIDQLQTRHRPSVVSIGNFDGVHRGHQTVIATLLKKSHELGAPSTVVTFDPLAREFFQPESVVRLTSVEERARLLFELGVEQVLCIPFTEQFAAYSPEGFIEDVLIDGLDVKYLSVGDDFRFGKHRAGDFELLQSVGRARGFEVKSHDTFTLDGERVSSGRVRDAIQAGDFLLASTLLGRDYAIRGRVVRGQQIGRTIDYPTANIVLENYRLAVNGVYAVWVELANGDQIAGVANVGNRPTVDGSEHRLEVHLFDFDGDIYDQTINVMFHHKIRDEQKFDSIQVLREQIAIDAQQAREFLAETTN